MGLAPPVILGLNLNSLLALPILLTSSFPRVDQRELCNTHPQTKLHLRTQRVSVACKALNYLVLAYFLQLHLVPLVPWDTALQYLAVLGLFLPALGSLYVMFPLHEKLFFLLSFLLICSQPKCYFLGPYPKACLCIVFNLTIQIRFSSIFFFIFCLFFH